MTIAQKIHSTWQVIIFITIGLIATVMNAWVPYHTLNILTNNAQLRKQAKESIEAVDEVLISLLNIETGKRGYVLTGDVRYLEPLNQSMNSINHQLENLARSATNIPKNDSNLKKINIQVKALIENAKTLNDVRKKYGLETAQKLVETGQGKKLMDDTRRSCSEIRAQANKYLAELRVMDTKNIRDAKLSILLLTLLDILLFGIAFFILFKTLFANKRIFNQLKRRTDELNLTLENLRITTDSLFTNQQALELSERQFRASFETAAIGMALVGIDGNWLKVNQSLCHILGYSQEELLKLTFQNITHPDDLELDLNHVRELLGGICNHYQMEKRYFNKNNHTVWANLSVSIVRDDNGNPIHFVAQIEDITVKKSYQDEMNYHAQFDSLTGLPNRRILMERMDHTRVRAKLHSHYMVVLFIDVDYFKSINDTYGHDVGDKVLLEVSQILSNSLRSTDTLGRLGGDEFVIVLSDINTKNDVETILHKIISQFSEPLTIDSIHIKVSLSIGAAIYSSEKDQSITELLKTADIALYEVKGRGRNGFEISAL